MSERQVIEQKLRKKQAEIQSLEAKLHGTKVYVTALQDILKLLSKESETTEAKLKAGSATAQAREAILNNGAPMHVDDLLRAVGKEVTRETKASLNSSIAAYARREEIFVRTGPNTYGLVELGHSSSEEAETSPVPPAGFGAFSSGFPDDDDDPPF